MRKILRGVRNCVFDLDGTLIDSKVDIASAILVVLRHYGIHHVKADQIYPHIGTPLVKILAHFIPGRVEEVFPEALQLYLGYYRPRLFENSTLYPGAVEVLQALRGHGINCAVATSKSTATAKIVADHFKLTPLMVSVRGTDNQKYKPDPDILITLMRDEGWKESETIMVGDTSHDIEAGKNAGILTCGVTHGASGAEILRPLKPDVLVDSLFDLPPALGFEVVPYVR